MNYARISLKLKEQILRFSGELSSGLPKVVRRFLREMIYGIQARQSVRLTEISRSLGERISIKKTHMRLSRQLGRDGLWKKIINSLCKLGSKRIKEDSLLVVDISDISKKYAKHMEYLARVRDGSEGEIANGYWTCNVVGVERGEVSIIPLYSKLYSQNSNDFLSENEEIKEAIFTVCSYTERRGIWVLDRGGARKNIIHPLLDKKLKFIIRLRGTRHLIYRGKRLSAQQLAESCPLPYMEKIVKEEGKEEKIYFLEFGMRRVKLPERGEQLSLIVFRELGKERIILLTNVELKRSRSSLWKIVESYLNRWRVEETIRFIKQSYQVEDIRLLTYKRLQNMMAMVMASAYFTMVYLGLRTKLRVLARHLLKAAKRVFGIPEFHFYALADGIKEFLFNQKKGITAFNLIVKNQYVQRSLFDP